MSDEQPLDEPTADVGCGRYHSPPPALGYLQWHYDADRRHRRGERQRQCPECGLWIWGSYWKGSDPRS